MAHIWAMAEGMRHGSRRTRQQAHRAHCRDHGCSVAEVNTALDRHPIEVDRDQFLRRTLGLELLRLDALEEAFIDKAFLDRDTAAGALLVKIFERRATLLGLNPPQGHAVQITQHEPATAQTSTDKIRAAVDRIRGKSLPRPDEPVDPEPPPTPH